MEPRIQYALTHDGASVAYWALGDGPPVIQMPSIPFTQIQAEWQDPDWNAWYQELLQHFQLIRYDTRGCGLSAASGQEYTLDSMVADLLGVADCLRLEQFGLIAPVQAGPAAIAFAARYPERVNRLVLWMAVTRGAEIRTIRFEALRQLSVVDWPLFCEATAHAIVASWDQAESAHRMATIMREGATAATHEATLNNSLEEDIPPSLTQIRCPVLVAHRHEGTPPPAVARKLAAAIPMASLVPFPGTSMLFLAQEAQAIAAAFTEFLSATPVVSEKRVTVSGFCTLLYTDIEGHTAILNDLGDERGRAILREHERIARQALRQHGGTEVLSTGDGFLARFDSAQAALECATTLQRELADASAELPVELRVRVGVNAGEPIVEGDELYGTAVVNAERIAAAAHGGEVLVANVVREIVAGKGFAFSDRGTLDGTGLDDAIRMWELRWAVAAT
ncbi:MAG TPA: adenylate/guanylate cyclase domain-containing protein [Tepidiformaceae bacterium]|nr:adenylate/guanylate cyclase domain-containing protein [Tepidiformaceae bacterium]